MIYLPLAFYNLSAEWWKHSWAPSDPKPSGKCWISVIEKCKPSTSGALADEQLLRVKEKVNEEVTKLSWG